MRARLQGQRRGRVRTYGNGSKTSKLQEGSVDGSIAMLSDTSLKNDAHEVAEGPARTH